MTDGVVRSSAGLQVDESLLTGESQPIDKGPGDPLLSGSFVVAGTGRSQATAVGVDAYARKLAAEARQFAPAHSELMDGINRILRYVTWAIVPVAALLLLSQIRSHSDATDAVSSVVAGFVGMVPQGLVLLTSVAFAAAAVTLARREVLVQELPAVEGLARVDVVCFDKTGTLTDGTIAFDRIERLDETVPVEAALGALADDVDGNATLAAVAGSVSCLRRLGPERSRAVLVGAQVERGDVRRPRHMGARRPRTRAAAARRPGRWRAPPSSQPAASACSFSLTQLRSLAGDRLPPDLRTAALVLLHEQVRPDAAAALAYFAEQGVALKVISGDSPHTVAAVAARLGMPHAERPCDARELPDEIDALGHMLEQQSVFGRVTPHQKQGMVKALQARGHTVAMTGDGVNDALALKLADVGVAMGSGASATRAVAQLVLLDGRFATLPGVVAEGRRITANMERVSNLFVAKTVWATLLAIAVGVAGWPYPFLPRQLTIIDTLTIGVPAFFLALAPNTRRHVPGFVDRVLRFALPAGLIIAAAAFAAFWLARAHDLPLVQQRTGATLVTFIVGLAVLVLMARPITWRRALLIAIMIASFLLALWIDWVRDFYALTLPREVLGETLVAGAAGVVVPHRLVGAVAATRRRAQRPTMTSTPEPSSSQPQSGARARNARCQLPPR